MDTANRLDRVDTPEFTQWFSDRMDAYTRNPWDVAVLDDLRHTRSRLTEFLLEADEEALQHLLSNQLAKLHLSLAGSGIRDLPLREPEQAQLDRILEAFTAEAGNAIPPGFTLAAMLYCRPEHPTAAFLDRPVPDWLCGMFTAFMAIEPVFFGDSHTFDAYCMVAHQAVRHTRQIVQDGLQSDTVLTPKARVAAHTYAAFSCPIYPYFGAGDLRQFSEDRAYILEQNACASGLPLDWEPPPRAPGRRKIRLGILKPHFSSQTETFATLPVFEYLDRKRFDIGLYALEAARNDLERYCANRVDRLQILSRNPLEQAAALRNENLDILFFGSNLTAGVDACTTLALHRLAPIQIASICCPVTTGFTHMDYYLAGDLLAPRASMQGQFREALLNIAGSGICFSFGPEPTGASKRTSREALGISADAVLFISGANYFKIIPELREAWASIVSRVPGAVLVLYPFNPNWSGRYNTEPFVADIKRRFAQHGLAEHQLRILDPLPGRADIKALLKLADVYLDSYPYGGATSLIDTLEAGLPPVVVEGDTLRFRQAPSMLRELGVPQLIAASAHAYIELACRLGSDTALRQQIRQDIQQNMKKRPAFLDSRNFGQKVAHLFQSLYERKFS
ncbi:MAG: hypothetical protein HY941_13585 [Gammaproteobacteria bacterium]|nr:hypothetical protein [Gammaproteobacteria bacterium]